MALFNTYPVQGNVNLDVTADLDTSWFRELITNERHDVAGTGGGYHIDYWRYHRIRTKAFKFVGLTRSAAQDCAAAMHALFNRKLLPQFLDMQTSIGLYWKRKTNPLQSDYTYQDCAKVSISKVAGDDWEVSVEVDEELTYNHTPRTHYYDELPPTWSAFEADPTSESFDSDFTGQVGHLNYGE